MPPSPAHTTKSSPTLHYPLQHLLQHAPLVLHQNSSAGSTTGSTLWTSSQVLTAFLPTLGLSAGRALELGAGIGLASLALAAAGWDVTATDVGDAMLLLRRNVAENAPGMLGKVGVRELDWFTGEEDVREHWDLVITADTLYVLELVAPLMRTIVAAAAGRGASKPAVVYMAVEVRDTALVEVAQREAACVGLRIRTVPRTRVRKAVKAALGWEEEQWAGVEVWRLVKM
ncbi:putative methyltransferase-domain-containing protein [Tricharina praecox]|uniref:putative methyltransferase-domain-containing protein n=1 Tax=Tricharina praecox TaxID=43433 RepID=UPI002220C647|nr:putative methyltransferase-domain-containing protein [Tricharina praecox]KAI5844298.1 putative methyltransferase-domain-containing protein [Tricharina praecox]